MSAMRHNRSMAEMPEGRWEDVYRDHAGLYGILGVFFCGSGLAAIAIGLPDVVADGGMKIYHGRSDTATWTWMPLGQAVPALVAFCLFFAAVGVFMVLYAVHSQIVTNDEGISQTNLFGKECFRARWEEIVEVSMGPTLFNSWTRVIASTGTLRFPYNHSCAADILRDIQRHTGQSPS